MNLTNIWQTIAAVDLSKTSMIIAAGAFANILAGAAVAVMAVSILNSLGRIAWGKISDIAGRKKTLLAIFLLCALALFFLNGLAAFWLFLAGVGIVGFCFGGFLALYPAITADYFGTKNIGANYGLMFSAYGAGGLLGPWLAPKLLSSVKDVPYETIDTAGKSMVKLFEAGNYSTSFFIAGALCLLAAFLITFLRPAANK